MGETGRVMPQAAPAPLPAATVPEKPKGAIGIWIGILLIVGGIVLGIVLVVAGARSLVDGFDDLQTTPINGEGIVRIEETGTQTIYAERPNYGGGSSFNTGTTFSGYGPNVVVRVIGPDGNDVPVSTGGSNETYTVNDREGIKIGTFSASAEGEYRIISRAQDNNGNWNQLAVGQALDISGIGAILGGVFGGGLVVLIGIIVVIIFAVRRSRSKKRINQASGPYPGGYGAPGMGWPAAPGYAPSGYGAPAAPNPAVWGTPAASNPGWVPPPVAQPGQQGSGPTWAPPPAPAPQAPPDAPTWQPPTPPPSSPPAGWPGADSPTAVGEPPSPPTDPAGPSWEPPAGDPPAPGGDSGSTP